MKKRIKFYPCWASVRNGTWEKCESHCWTDENLITSTWSVTVIIQCDIQNVHWLLVFVDWLLLHRAHFCEIRCSLVLSIRSTKHPRPQRIYFTDLSFDVGRSAPTFSRFSPVQLPFCHTYTVITYRMLLILTRYPLHHFVRLAFRGWRNAWFFRVWAAANPHRFIPLLLYSKWIQEIIVQNRVTTGTFTSHSRVLPTGIDIGFGPKDLTLSCVLLCYTFTGMA